MSYQEPGNVNELSTPLKARWTDEQIDLFNSGIEVAKNEASPPSTTSWMFNPITNPPGNAVMKDIKWNAFPKRLLDTFGSKLAAWKESDRTRDRQEEYCEWETVRNPADNTLSRVTFTTEVPDYYSFLYQHDKSFLLDLYHRHISPKVQLSHLERLDENGNKAFLPKNIWNYPELQGKRGVLMHMAFGPNTLAAAVFLSAEATWPSIDGSGKIITDEQGLIDCRQYGERERHSDPHIGAEINALIRSGYEISFADPAGLYIDSIDLSNFELPGGADPNSLVRVTRGDNQHMMRVVFEAPAGSNFRLSDVKIDGNKLFFGGQIAEKLTIRIRGIAQPAAKPAPSIKCQDELARPESAALGVVKYSSRKSKVEFITSVE